MPYSTHAPIDQTESLQAESQAEARRKTEEFMRNFHAQRDVESQQETEAPVEAQPVDQMTASGEASDQVEEQSQEILKEIFSQQQILDEVHYTDPAQENASQSNIVETHDGQGADSVSVETPVSEYGNYQQSGEPPKAQDDRDMLYVNETQQYTPPQAPEPPQSPPFPNVETSTGNAERVDYNQLFDQLRNFPKQT